MAVEPVVGESYAFQLGETSYTGLVKSYNPETGNVTLDHFGHDVQINLKKDTIKMRHNNKRMGNGQGQARRG